MFALISNLSFSHPAAETTDRLDDPDRGFYYIHRFRVADSADMTSAVADDYIWDAETSLSLVEIDLVEYRRGQISESGLSKVRELFDALRNVGKRYIIRFAYDFEGAGIYNEPAERSVIETHMRQLGGIVSSNSDIIFTLQGLFTGSWGEMNGTRYGSDSDLVSLFDTLIESVGDNVFLSVRKPSQLRIITGKSRHGAECEKRLGLFNDGISGSDSDLGTYGITGRTEQGEQGFYESWVKSDEVDFVNDLCRKVPYGGEAIIDNKLNDFENAVEYLSKLHVSYLNLGYDREVLEKWEKHTVKDSGIWNGIDGLSYIERHLGYRFAAENIKISHSIIKDKVNYSVYIKNVGFAPVYGGLSIEITLSDHEMTVLERTVFDHPDCDICNGEKIRIKGAFSLTHDERKNFILCIRATGIRTGRALKFANFEKSDDNGYIMGKIKK